MIAYKIIDAIIAENLLAARCAHDPSHGCLVVWSSAAAEQIDAIIQSASPVRTESLEDALRERFEKDYQSHDLTFRNGIYTDNRTRYVFDIYCDGAAAQKNLTA